MSDEFVAGIVIGLVTGGLIGTLMIALVQVGSDRRPPAPRKLRMSVDLLPDPQDVDRSSQRSVAETNDLEREMRELVRRYGSP